ncbi:lysozyme [Azospirillum sp. TSA2s]|uniref:glycoside hydrolase family protein n=1 Tax=Azospirillum sp. TSA2s TaxID=709810 RepID=UPI0010AB12B4|nr:lysozyme [Azospirillum sp. TSA2s]
MTKPVCSAAVEMVKHFEGLYLRAYKCPAGVWTCGWGATGDGVTPTTVWTREQAEARLAADLAEAADDVDRYVKVPLNDDERGALSSFTFNLGGGALASSTLLRLLNSGDMAGAAGQFGRWTKATVNGKAVDLAGLVSRRSAEAALFQGRDWTDVAPAVPDPQPQAVTAPAGPDGDRIKRIQSIVGVVPDGHYGPLTKAAVSRWQTAHSLQADGVVGPRTAAAMGL